MSLKKYLISIDSDDGVRLKNFFAQQIFATCKNDFMKFGVKGAELTVKEYFDLGVAGHNKALTPSELGCTLSHLEALKDFLSSDNQYAIVFEDDAIERVSFILDALEPEVKALNLKDGFLLSLGGIQLSFSEKVKGRPLEKLLFDHTVLEIHPYYYKNLSSTYAYLLDRKMAEILILYHQIPKGCDHWGGLAYLDEVPHLYATYLFDHPEIEIGTQNSYIESERLSAKSPEIGFSRKLGIFDKLLKKLISLFLKKHSDL